VPELPEVESVRRTIAPLLVGGEVLLVQCRRRDVVRGAGRSIAAALLRGGTIVALHRHGKQLAVEATSGAVGVHLGMSGRLWAEPLEGSRRLAPHAHEHLRWTLRAADGGRVALRFVDPRRFGGVWCAPDLATLQRTLWAPLGPDARSIDGPCLHRSLRRTRRAIKTALMDQRLIAGIGNIYADEALFAAGIHPVESACDLAAGRIDRLAEAIRDTLERAIDAGGSTLRDYRDGRGREGAFQDRHQVYGRSGTPCGRCGAQIAHMRLGGRTTCWCGVCQYRA
jgi:formamidopyrimidine-DNA glycosylase